MWERKKQWMTGRKYYRRMKKKELGEKERKKQKMNGRRKK